MFSGTFEESTFGNETVKFILEKRNIRATNMVATWDWITKSCSFIKGKILTNFQIGYNPRISVVDEDNGNKDSSKS